MLDLNKVRKDILMLHQKLNNKGDGKRWVFIYQYGIPIGVRKLSASET